MFSAAVNSRSPSVNSVSSPSSSRSCPLPLKKNKNLIHSQSNLSLKKKSKKTPQPSSKMSSVALPSLEFNAKATMSTGSRLKSHGSNSLKFSIDSLLTRKERPVSPSKNEEEDMKTHDATSSVKRDQRNNTPKTECNHTDFDDDDADIEVEDDNMSRSEDEGSDSCEDRMSVVSSNASNNAFHLIKTQASHLNGHPHLQSLASFPQMNPALHPSHPWSLHLNGHPMVSPLNHNHHPFLGWMRSTQSGPLSPSSVLSEYFYICSS